MSKAKRDQIKKFNYWNGKKVENFPHNAQSVLMKKETKNVSTSCGAGSCNCGGGCNGECGSCS